MRPVRRGPSPQANDFDPYDEAKPFLIARLGCYCSYCERRIANLLAVEHIQPKGLPAYAHLIGCWDNFLLGCINCNSTKNNKPVVLADIFLPDRDNTFVAFTYSPDGKVTPSQVVINAGLGAIAQRTLALTGLDKSISLALDENGKQVAIDRVSQRMEVWGIAQEVKADVDAYPDNEAVKRGAVRTAQGHGFFSIWLTVFQDNQDMCNRLVDAFAGTRASGCFDAITADVVTPAPNPDGLAGGGKT
jgi:hypothetical protein